MRINLVAIAKNEARYIGEWLAYHLSLGFDQIFVFDNESSDGTTDILRRASSVYPVETMTWSTVDGISIQLSAYNHYREQHPDPDTLTGFIDIDEFIVSRVGGNPVERLRELGADPTVGAVCINQRVFGDAGKPDYTPEPILKRLTHCSAPDYNESLWVKSFYRLPYVERVTVHSSPLTKGRHVHPDGSDVAFEGEQPYSQASRVDFSLMQLNHYITKTLGEFRAKQQRGGVAAAKRDDRMARYSDGYFFNRQPMLNEVACGHSALVAKRVDALIAAFNDRLPPA